MIILGLDPGNRVSHLVGFDADRQEVRQGWVMSLPNDEMLGRLARWGGGANLVIERIATYGMRVGFEVLDTCWWSGRFYEAWAMGRREMMLRATVKTHLCGKATAKDANVRGALIERWGGYELAVRRCTGKAKGRKNWQTGPLHGLIADQWQALAVAVAWADVHYRPAPKPLDRAPAVPVQPRL